MKEEHLRENLKKIEDLSARKEAREIYQSVFEQLVLYQEKTLRKLEQQVQNSIAGCKVDYGIDMFLTTHEDSRKWADVCEVIDETRVYSLDWNQKRIKRVYLDLSRHQLQQVKSEQRKFRAVVRTDYDVYGCIVTLQESDTYAEKVDRINKMMECNGIDNPLLPNCFVERFHDVVFKVQHDKLRAGERIIAIEIDWEELAPYVKEDIVLLWNVRQCRLKERAFPVPEQQEIRYVHELIPKDMRFAYLVDVSDMRNYEINRQQDILIVKTTQKEYKEWDVYEIVPRREWEKAGTAENVLSNRINLSIIDQIQRGKRNTKAELYRTVGSFEVTTCFERIEVQDKEIQFYAKSDTYISRACMDMIMADIQGMYDGLGLTGIFYSV